MLKTVCSTDGHHDKRHMLLRYVSVSTYGIRTVTPDE